MSVKSIQTLYGYYGPVASDWLSAGHCRGSRRCILETVGRCPPPAARRSRRGSRTWRDATALVRGRFCGEATS